MQRLQTCIHELLTMKQIEFCPKFNQTKLLKCLFVLRAAADNQVLLKDRVQWSMPSLFSPELMGST